MKELCAFYLDSVFQCHEEVEPLLLADGGQADAVVQISQLSGSDGVLSFNLNQTTVRCSPLMRRRRLGQIQLSVSTCETERSSEVRSEHPTVTPAFTEKPETVYKRWL